MNSSGTTTVRAAILAVLTAAVLAGCAQPGQLGSAPVPTPDAAPPAAPSEAGPSEAAAPSTPVPEVLGTGRLDDRLTLRTQGPADVSVRTVALAPGESSGWRRNPGSELVVVRSGGVVVQLQDACDDQRYAAGAAFSVPDGRPYQVRNDGSDPVELVETRLFAPGLTDPEDVPPAC